MAMGTSHLLEQGQEAFNQLYSSFHCNNAMDHVLVFLMLLTRKKDIKALWRSCGTAITSPTTRLNRLMGSHRP
jgi:hypothetical protein